MRTLSGLLAALAVALAARASRAQEAVRPDERPDVAWVLGPATVALGDDVAQLALPDGFAFAPAADARRILEEYGNRTDGSELGVVVPTAEDQRWFIVFDWSAVGLVPDDDRDIDADALLEDIREATEEGNAWRKERGMVPFHVTGWAEPPRYEEATHRLVWATLARGDDGHESANYHVRLLGRRGYVSAALVAAPDRLAAAKPQAHAVVAAVGFKSGSSYSEWKLGDPVSEYGLATLVTGPAGTAAARTGLLARAGKVLARDGKAIGIALAGLAALLGWSSHAGRGGADTRKPRPPPPAA